MKAVRVLFDSAGSRFLAAGSHRGQEISINAPKVIGERRGPSGFSATELLLASAGSCAAWDVLEIMRKRRQDLDSLEVIVEGEQTEDAPWSYRRVTLHFRVEGRALRAPVVERVIRLSCVRYCSVLATIRGVAEVTATMELVDAAGTSSGRLPVSLAIQPAESIEEVADPGVAIEPPATDED